MANSPQIPSSKMNTEHPPWYILPVIVLAQFAGTSLWFAGNAVLADLQAAYQLPLGALGGLTSAVQLGFISGTLLFAILTIADRFSPSRVFLVSALLGALFNLGVGSVVLDYPSILVMRFLTGFFLAGIYPVGMKIAADWYAKGLGKALGYLVGALVLGTAFPHFLRYYGADLSWTFVLQGASLLAVLGGLAIGVFVPDGPGRKPGRGFNPVAIVEVFRYPDFRSAALGYFGHMWELYAFWAFVPFILASRFPAMQESTLSLFSFLAIAFGGLGCVFGGYWSLRLGSVRIAFGMLLVSGLLCLFSPAWMALDWIPFLLLLFLWGFTVVGDSPQFSTLVARNVPAELRGSALTIVNSIGFAITIFSIQLLTYLAQSGYVQWMYVSLGMGPLLGLAAVLRLMNLKNFNK